MHERGDYLARTRKENRSGSVRKLDNGIWECVIQSRYCNPETGNPKRIKRKGKTEAEATKNAQMELKRWEKQIIQGRDTRHNKRKLFSEYMKEFLEGEVKSGLTDSGYHSYVRTMHANFFAYPISNYQLHMLNKAEFQRYYDDIQSKKSHKTCLVPRQLCIRCCRWLVDQSLLEENYAEQATLRRTVADEYDRERASDNANRKRVFTAEDIQKFYNAFKNNMGEYPVVVLFLLETGMRISEFASLRNDNINLDSGRIDIVETRAIRFVDDKDHSKGIEEYVKVPKNKEARFVIMSELAKECVLYMMEQTKLKCKNNPDNLLYPSFRSGKRRTNCSMEVCFKDLCDKLEIDRDVRMSVTRDKDGNELYVKKGLCLHDLRHTSDSIANAVAGANVVNTALKMGHKAITTENVYTHATEEGLASVRTPSQVFLDGYKKDGAEPDTSSEKRISELEAQIEALKKMLEASSK